MKGILKVEPLHREGVEALARHSFHIGEDDNVRSMWDRVLYGHVDAVGALGLLPERQPDTGRRLVANTRHAAHLKFTLPAEIDPEDADRVRRWAAITTEWFTQKCAGVPVYAVLHLDGERPHIHAVTRAADPDTGHISFPVQFHKGVQALLRHSLKTYLPMVEPLGVRTRRTKDHVGKLLRLPPIGADFQCPACEVNRPQPPTLHDPVMLAPVTPGLTERFTPLEHREWAQPTCAAKKSDAVTGSSRTAGRTAAPPNGLVSSIIGIVPKAKTGEFWMRHPVLRHPQPQSPARFHSIRNKGDRYFPDRTSSPLPDAHCGQIAQAALLSLLRFA